MDFKPPKDLIINEDVANNWRLFKQKFQIFLTASGSDEKDDEVKVAMLLNCVGDEALEAFNTFDLPEKDKKTFDKVIEAFDVFCEPRKNITYNRFQFFSRRQQEGESFDHFLTDLKRLAKLCEFREETSLVRDLIVIGVSDRSLQERLLRDSDLKITDAISQCRAAECSRQQIQLLQSTSKEVSVVNKRFNANRRSDLHNNGQNFNKNGANNSYSTSKQGEQKSGNSFKCGKCNRTHGFRECPALGNCATLAVTRIILQLCVDFKGTFMSVIWMTILSKKNFVLIRLSTMLISQSGLRLLSLRTKTLSVNLTQVHSVMFYL